MIRVLIIFVLLFFCSCIKAQDNSGTSFDLKAGVQGVYAFYNSPPPSRYEAIPDHSFNLAPFISFGMDPEFAPISTNLLVSTCLWQVNFIEQIPPFSFAPPRQFNFRCSTVEQHINYSFSKSFQVSVGGAVRILHNASYERLGVERTTEVKTNLSLAPLLAASYSLNRYYVKGIVEIPKGYNRIFDTQRVRTYSLRLCVGYDII